MASKGDKKAQDQIAVYSPGFDPDILALIEGCTDYQKAWTICYLGPAFPNKAEAARMCGSGDSSNVTGSQTSRIPAVAAAIALWLSKKGVTRERIIERLAQIAFTDASELQDEKGMPDITRVKSHALGGIVRGYEFHAPSEYSSETTLKSVDIAAPEKALELLGKTIGLFVERHEHDFTKLSDAELIQRAAGLFAGVAETGTEPS